MALGRKTGGRVKGSCKVDDLQAFARRVEKQILAAGVKDCETMERLVCRLITNPKNPAVAATLLTKWVEWRYPKQAAAVSGENINLIFNAPRPNFGITEEKSEESSTVQ